MWCIPAASAEYVACMEDVLDQYERPYDAQYPQVCFDEGLKQLIEETRKGYPCRPGQKKRYDYEYKRNGVRNLNMFYEPLAGKRYVRITERHTMIDFAQGMKWLVDVLYPHVTMIRVVMDNLGPHKPASLYEAFPPEEARRILKKLEFHFTPKHGSWLDMAEIELSVYSRRLKQHIPNESILEKEIQAITIERNGTHAVINWQFRTEDARIKLKQLYPSTSA
jgi:DDE superfamily endonuclease